MADNITWLQMETTTLSDYWPFRCWSLKLGLYSLRLQWMQTCALVPAIPQQQQTCSTASCAMHRSINRWAYTSMCRCRWTMCWLSVTLDCFFDWLNNSASRRWPWKFNMVELHQCLPPLTSTHTRLQWTAFAPEVYSTPSYAERRHLRTLTGVNKYKPSFTPKSAPLASRPFGTISKHSSDNTFIHMDSDNYPEILGQSKTTVTLTHAGHWKLM